MIFSKSVNGGFMRKIDVEEVRQDILKRIEELKAKGIDSDWAGIVYRNCNKIFAEEKEMDEKEIDCYFPFFLRNMMGSDSPLTAAYEMEKCYELLPFLNNENVVAIVESVPRSIDSDCDFIWLLAKDSLNDDNIYATTFSLFCLDEIEPIKFYSYPVCEEMPEAIPDRILEFYKQLNK